MMNVQYMYRNYFLISGYNIFFLPNISYLNSGDCTKHSLHVFYYKHVASPGKETFENWHCYNYWLASGKIGVMSRLPGCDAVQVQCPASQYYEKLARVVSFYGFTDLVASRLWNPIVKVSGEDLGLYCLSYPLQ